MTDMVKMVHPALVEEDAERGVEREDVLVTRDAFENGWSTLGWQEVLESEGEPKAATGKKVKAEDTFPSNPQGV